LLDKYAQYISQQITQWVEEGKTPREELCHLKSIDIFADTSADTNDKDPYEETSHKRTRKPTQIIQESKEQEDELSETKKKRKKVEPANQTSVPKVVKLAKQKGVSGCARKGKDKKVEQKPANSKNAEKNANIDASKEMLNCIRAFSHNFPSSSSGEAASQKANRGSASEEVNQGRSTSNKSTTNKNDNGYYHYDDEISDDEVSISTADSPLRGSEQGYVLQELEPRRGPLQSRQRPPELQRPYSKPQNSPIQQLPHHNNLYPEDEDTLQIIEEYMPKEPMKLSKTINVIAQAMKTVHDFATSETEMESHVSIGTSESFYQKRALHLEEENKLLRAEIERLKGREGSRSIETTSSPGTVSLHVFPACVIMKFKI